MRRRLLDAATHCFAANGYTATGVAEITAAAGTAHGNFYRHFANVDEVLLAVVHEPLEELLEVSRECGPIGGDTGLTVLEAWITAHLEVYVRHRRLLLAFREAAAVDRNGAFVKVWLEVRHGYVALLEQWIRDARTAHSIADPVPAEALAEALGGTVETLCQIRFGATVAEPDGREIGDIATTVAAIAQRTVVGPAGAGWGGDDGR